MMPPQGAQHGGKAGTVYGHQTNPCEWAALPACVHAPYSTSKTQAGFFQVHSMVEKLAQSTEI